MLCGCSCDRCKHTANLWHTLSPLPGCFRDRRGGKKTQPNKNRRRHRSAKRRRHRSLSLFRPPPTPDPPRPVTVVHSLKSYTFRGCHYLPAINDHNPRQFDTAIHTKRPYDSSCGKSNHADIATCMRTDGIFTLNGTWNGTNKITLGIR